MSVKKAKKSTSREYKDKAYLFAQLKPVTEKQTKSQILSSISEEVFLQKKAVNAVFASLAKHIARHMKKGGSGEFTIPETHIRVKRKMVPPRKKKIGRNPATGEQVTISAKPARVAVRVIALRGLKESVNL